MHETRLDENGNLKPEFAEKAAVKDFFCPGCKKPVDLFDGWIIITNRKVACECGISFDIFTALVVFSPENPAFKYFRESSTREATWFHATHDPKWERVLSRKASIPVHVGTETAAFDRALGIYISRYPQVIEQTFELYELRLKPDARIADRIIHDANSEKVILRGSDVTRYINRWEDPASISLAARSSVLELVSHRTVKSSEARERISIYNVRP
jgi:hypothetical protein